MRIAAVKCMLVSAPYASPQDVERTRHLKSGFRPAAFIKIETGEELYGLGETYAGVYAPEVVRETVAQFEYDLLNQDPMNTLELWGRIRLSSYYWGRMGVTQSIIGGIELALWDLKGKTLGVPVYELLGGKAHAQILVYASGGNNKPFDELQREMEGYVRAGFRAVKIRINPWPGCISAGRSDGEVSLPARVSVPNLG